mmetsp:Transcript_25165/g.37185  ORF Transcript_25165/g.37185 Transcript_25165/m.37185 type:complete len:569 (+) Transcript_25165:70-1776(+)|eukprot:CAMPEP_0194214504 /NCGR_PEP_ID=MMETSP0156-20130528/15714_1 /TAXON_ID=33649 /ORGANISM="Thalassionema nitzschioides, Strain L26-B" /LENGTH=568 /DNA_ID=CAMNT_0038942773 /DNA_START=28 /DNA_END=1734 /DNA_ORIENTATION=+
METPATSSSSSTTPVLLKCDYLIVGAGASSLAFLDTILTENPSLKIILVDQKAVPGGHWVDDYDYVQLHQPSLVYGLASKLLEGSWWKLMFCKGMLPWKHRASKEELLTYFQIFLEEKIASGQAEYYPSCHYDFCGSSEKLHAFHSLDVNGNKNNQAVVYKVDVAIKLINGVLGENKIPSQCPVQFPVHPDITLITPNDLYPGRIRKWMATTTGGEKKRFVVLGCGKTAMDTVVYLRSVMKIPAERITWIIPNDVWMMSRETDGGTPDAILEAIIRFGGNEVKAIHFLEQKGILVRLDKTVTPTRFRFPVIGKDELKIMREIQDIIRRGRVSAIDAVTAEDDKKKKARLHFKNGTNNDDGCWISPSDSIKNDVFIHCTSPGPSNGNIETRIFVGEQTMNLLLLYSPPISISMSCLGYLESARIKTKLDIEFGRKLLRVSGGGKKVNEMNDTDVLGTLFFTLEETTAADKDGEGKIGTNNDADNFGTMAKVATMNLALFLALANVDPLVGYNWLKQNRLSFVSIPGFKCKIYETMTLLSQEKEGFLGISSKEIKMFGLLATKLEPLKGK